MARLILRNIHLDIFYYEHTDDGLLIDREMEYYDENKTNGTNQVGIKITMQRVTTSFIMKYYVPCIAIVLVSEIGFIIPVTAIPGRVGLLVTQFLTLINLFIHQMVSKTLINTPVLVFIILDPFIDIPNPIKF